MAAGSEAGGWLGAAAARGMAMQSCIPQPATATDPAKAARNVRRVVPGRFTAFDDNTTWNMCRPSRRACTTTVSRVDPRNQRCLRCVRRHPEGALILLWLTTSRATPCSVSIPTTRSAKLRTFFSVSPCSLPRPGHQGPHDECERGRSQQVHRPSAQYLQQARRVGFSVEEAVVGSGDAVESEGSCCPDRCDQDRDYGVG
jgi:hypothetical protein